MGLDGGSYDETSRPEWTSCIQVVNPIVARSAEKEKWRKLDPFQRNF